MGGSSGSGMFGANSPLVAKAVQQNTPSNAGAAYTPTQQGARYTPQYQQYQAPMQQAPTQQAPTQQAPMQLQGMGLNDLLTNMMQQYSRPMMRAPMQQMPVQQGIAPYSGLNYRPNMAQPNLNRVAPSVELQQRLAAEAEAKRAAEEAANKPSSQGAIPTGYDNG